MIYDLQKASMWKRLSAYIFDVIMLGMLAVGLAALLSVVLGYDSYNERLDECYNQYEELYKVDFDISQEDYDALSEEDRLRYEEAADALSKDTEAGYVYSMIFNLTLIIVTFSILLSYLVLEFTVPLLFKNGQTLGKKVFGIAVMRTDGIKLTAPFLFIRTILGKFTVETMIPVLVLIMVFFNAATLVGVVIVGLILLLQIVLIIATRTNSPIHDVIAHTVAVDMASQMIFESREAMIEYQKRIHAESVAAQEY